MQDIVDETSFWKTQIALDVTFNKKGDFAAITRPRDNNNIFNFIVKSTGTARVLNIDMIAEKIYSNEIYIFVLGLNKVLRYDIASDEYITAVRNFDHFCPGEGKNVIVTKDNVLYRSAEFNEYVILNEGQEIKPYARINSVDYNSVKDLYLLGTDYGVSIVYPFKQITKFTGLLIVNAKFSPNGEYIAFYADKHIHILRINTDIVFSAKCDGSFKFVDNEKFFFTTDNLGKIYTFKDGMAIKVETIEDVRDVFFNGDETIRVDMEKVLTKEGLKIIEPPVKETLEDLRRDITAINKRIDEIFERLNISSTPTD